MANTLKLMLLPFVATLVGCAPIPEADIDWLDGNIPLGMDQSEATKLVGQRGFAAIELRPSVRTFYDMQTRKPVTRRLSEKEMAQQNLGFVDVVGEPTGSLFCFSRPYGRLIGSGDRIICWTTDTNRKITWRQAGWFGVTL